MPPIRLLLDLHELRPWRGITKSLGQLALLAGLALFTLSSSREWFLTRACGFMAFTARCICFTTE